MGHCGVTMGSPWGITVGPLLGVTVGSLWGVIVGSPGVPTCSPRGGSTGRLVTEPGATLLCCVSAPNCGDGRTGVGVTAGSRRGQTPSPAPRSGGPAG